MLLRRLTLSKPLLEQAVLIPLDLEFWAQPDIGLNLSLHLLISVQAGYFGEAGFPYCDPIG